MNAENHGPQVLAVGGTDPGAGAGLYRDLLTLSALGVHGHAVVSMLTAQDGAGLHAAQAVDAALFTAQLESVLGQFQPRVIKLGVIAGAEQARVLGGLLSPETRLVWDPVMAPSSGGRMISPEQVREVLAILGDRVDLLTPNLDEAAAISGREIAGYPDMARAVDELRALGPRNVLLKGGHAGFSGDECHNLLAGESGHLWTVSPRLVDAGRTRGTGCAFASACAAALALGYETGDAVVLAHGMVSDSLARRGELHGMLFPGAVRWPQSWKELAGVRYGKSPARTHAPIARCDSQRLGIYPVVDGVDWIRRLLDAGIRTIQLRIKQAGADELERAVRDAVALARAHDARLFINDHWEAAIRHGAYGVHLGQEDLATADLARIAGSGLRLGLSTHCLREVAAAVDVDPSYIAIGPVFETDSKPMAFAPQGIDGVARWARMLGGRWPLVAIGGIDAERARRLRGSGVGSVAMISAITRAHDPEAAARELVNLWEAPEGGADC